MPKSWRLHSKVGRRSFFAVQSLIAPCWSMRPCRIGAWAESISPSTACSQLHSCTRKLTYTFSSGTRFHSRFGSAGGFSRSGPM